MPSPPSSLSDRVVGIALAVAGVIAFSLRPVLVKLAYAYVTDPVTLLALRMIFSLPFFAVAAWLGRDAGRGRLDARDRLAIGGLGFIGYYVASFLDFLGLQYVSAGVGRLFLFLYPTIVVLLSALFLKKPVRWREAAALLITYAGVALVLSASLGTASPDLPFGAALVFASAAFYAVYLVAGSRLVLKAGSIRFAAQAMLVASAFCIVQFLLLRPLAALALPGAVYGLMLAVAILSTVLPVFMTAEALRRIGANQVAIIGALGPVSAIGFGYIGLGETMTPPQLAGAALVLLGVLLVSLRPTA
jgi:drug/metabolite transporter (DMT)-like permease